MRITIENFHIKENPLNEVTSEKVFKPRRTKDKDGNWRFHDEGIFSPVIFGKLYKCSCGANEEPGTWCKICGDRVVSKDKMPDFYIPTGVRAPFVHTDYSVFGRDAKQIKMLLEYGAFLYDGEFVEFDLSKLDISQYPDNDKILIGVEAAQALSPKVTDEWIKKNTSTNVPVPHPIYRPIIETTSGRYILGSLNDVLIDLLDKRAKILSFKEEGDGNKFQELTLNKLLYDKYVEVIYSIFEILLKGKKSVMKQEVVAQPISGAFRAVITNNDSLDEDIILIGYELVETIYPHLVKRYGEDWDAINEHLKRHQSRVVVNRPPTIGEKSVIAMKPVINKDPMARFVISTNSIIFDGMAADTDGDVFLVISLYTDEANREADEMLPSRNYIGGSNGKVRNKMPEDFEFAMSQIYKKDPELRDRIKQIIAENLQ